MVEHVHKCQAMILAAGHGSRLGPLTERVAKPALWCLGSPLVDLPLASLQAAGFQDVSINTHHLPKSIWEAVARCDRSLSVEYNYEPELLGSGGGIQNMWKGVTDAALILNSDVFCDVDLNTVIERHFAHDAYATMVVKRVASDHPKARLICARERVTQIEVGESRLSDARFVFTGYYLLSAHAVASLPDKGKAACVVRDGLMPWLEQGRRIAAYALEGAWLDFGEPEPYWRSILTLARGDVGDGNCLNKNEYAATMLRGAYPDSVVAPSAKIADGVRVQKCVAWPQTHIVEDIERAIITPYGTLSF